MLYRVVWLDPPPPAPAGVWDYQGFDAQDRLIVTGVLAIASSSNPIAGTWRLDLADGPAPDIGPQIGIGSLEGDLHGLDLSLNLNPGWADRNVFLFGQLIANHYQGHWSYSTIGGTRATGRFVADRRESDP